MRRISDTRNEQDEWKAPLVLPPEEPTPVQQGKVAPWNDGNVQMGDVFEPKQEPGFNKVQTYEEMFRELNNKPVRQDPRRETREKLFAAIGDGISSLSNLYFTTQGAPNAYNPNITLSGAYKQRWDTLNGEYKSLMERYRNGLLAARTADKKAEAQANAAAYQARQDAFDNALKAADSERKDKELAGNLKKNEALARKAEADAKAAEIAAQYTPRQQEAELEKIKAQTAASRASAAKTYQETKVYQDKNYTTVPNGRGQMVKIPNTNLNEQSIAYIFAAFGVPDTYEVATGRTNNQFINGLPVSVEEKKKVKLTKEQMLQYIGQNIDKPEFEEARARLDEIYKGERPSELPSLPAGNPNVSKTPHKSVLETPWNRIKEQVTDDYLQKIDY